MKKFMKAFHKGERGFTLIELLVVIAILGTIAGVVVLNIGSFIGRGHNEAACTELHNVQTAVVAYMSEHTNAIPTSGDMGGTGIGPYLLTTAKGTYTWDGTGKVTQTAYSGGASCNSTG